MARVYQRITYRPMNLEITGNAQSAGWAGSELITSVIRLLLHTRSWEAQMNSSLPPSGGTRAPTCRASTDNSRAVLVLSKQLFYYYYYYPCHKFFRISAVRHIRGLFQALLFHANDAKLQCTLTYSHSYLLRPCFISK